MITDDELEIPDFLKRKLGEKAKAGPPPVMPWAKLAPEPEAVAEAAEVQAIKAEQTAQRKIKADNRIKRMLAKKEDHTGQRWDGRRGKWVPNTPGWWKARKGTTSMDISIEQRTYVNHNTAARAARRALGKPGAIEGEDFAVNPHPKGGFAFAMKMPEKIAKGPTNIQRQFGAGVEPAAQPEKDDMKKTTPKKAKAAKPKAAKKPAKAKTAKPARSKVVKAPKAAAEGKQTKTQIVGELLRKAEGTTREEILKATGWPAVTVPGMAKSLGLKLRKEKVKGESTRYWGEAA